MYVIQSKACIIPNGQTPVSPQQIQQSQAVLGAMNSQVDKALAAMQSLIQRNDLNAAGQQTNAGLPASASVNPNGSPKSGQVRSFDPSPVPPSSMVIRVEEFPTMCQGYSVAPTSFTDPSPCYGAASEAPPMDSIISPPVGVQPQPQRQGPCSSGCGWMWGLLGLGAVAWFMKGTK